MVTDLSHPYVQFSQCDEGSRSTRPTKSKTKDNHKERMNRNKEFSLEEQAMILTI